jgi:hypothetical protein
MNKLCNVASCWIYIVILLAHPILHISRIRVNAAVTTTACQLTMREFRI